MISLLSRLPAVFTADVVGLLFMFAFIYPLNHRPRFALRFALSSAVLMAVDVVLLALGGKDRYAGALILVYMLVQLGQVALCTQQPFSGWVYTTIWVVMLQQFTLQMWGVVSVLLPPAGWYLIVVVAALAAALVWGLVARNMPQDGAYHIGPKQLLSGILLLTVFQILSSNILVNVQAVSFTGRWGMLIMCEFYCITILYLQYALFKKSAVQHELLTMDMLWRQQKDQYDLAKENIDLINQKCHDLKHQVRGLRGMADGKERERYLDEIDQSIRIYDSILKTGSEVLDTILTEKSLLCSRQHIHVQCVADGSRMNFIDPVDIYAIFGNALDNAIEEVQRFAEADKRQIDVLVYIQNQFLVINVTNPLAAPPRFQHGLPVTTKGDNGYHGFGLKSVRHTVKKYDGFLTIGTEGGCFSLKIVIPLPANQP